MTVEFTPELHRRLFADFCQLKTAVRGPDVHMKLAVEVAPEDPKERAWWYGVYTNFCAVPPAAALHRAWPWERVQREPEKLENWVRENWPGLPVRKNRRPVRAPQKLTTGLLTYAAWVKTVMFEDGTLTTQDYQSFWDSANAGVKYMGRYALVKLAEVFRLDGHEQLVAPDIRPVDGWSPRKCLGYLYPEVPRKGNQREIIELVNNRAAETREHVSQWMGRELSFYELEALLCNYRQTFDGDFYVGRTIDSELEYDHKIVAHFGAHPYAFDMADARDRVFPSETLGEQQGWDGVRKDLFGTLPAYGYIWSDMLYDYTATTDLAHPVHR